MFHITESMQSYWNKKNKKKATRDDIEKIETEFDITLSPSYVEFITRFGFVLFDEDFDGFDYIITFPDRQEIHQGDIGYLENPDNIIIGYNNLTTAEYEGDPYNPVLPPNYLPVGNDAGQGQILLKMKGDRAGSVWYWPYKEWAWGTEDNTWLGFVAEDFYEFINKLRPYE